MTELTTIITFGITTVITIFIFTLVLVTSDRALYISSVVLDNIIGRIINRLGYIGCGLVDTMIWLKERSRNIIYERNDLHHNC